MSNPPVNLLYIVLAVITLATGVVILVWQTGATRLALRERKGNLFGGVLLILLGGFVLALQLYTLLR